jgi:hypothetical protein
MAPIKHEKDAEWSMTRPLKNVQFWPRSRKAKISTTGIYVIFRGLKFEPDQRLGKRGYFSKVSYLVPIAFFPSI